METHHQTPAEGHRNRIVIAVLCALMLILAALPMLTFSAKADSGEIVARTITRLNLRTGAGKQYASQLVVPKGSDVTILDRSNTHWIRVKLSNGKTGYLYAEFLDILTDCTTDAYLNFRTGPDTKYACTQTFAPGVKLDILSFSGNSWAQVKTSDGKTGYICTDYVTYQTPATVKPAQFSISHSSYTLAKGQKFSLLASGSQGSVSYKTSDGKVATVDSRGLVQGVSAGTATITVTDSKLNKSLTCKVTVKAPEYQSIKLSATSANLQPGQSFNLTATTTPAGGKYTLKSSDTSVATVSSSGSVKAVSGGTANITASDSSGTVSAVCSVKVAVNGSITLNDKSISVDVGSSKKISFSKTPSNLTVKWTSSNTKVAGVTNGVVSGLSAGSATITASDESGKIRATCNVTVRSVSSGNVRLSRYSASTTAGKTIYIKGYNGAKWQTSDSNVATVWDGFIETKNPGKAAISYVDYYGNRAVCTVTVTDPAPVRFSYSSPNSATLKSSITLVAITDQKRSSVYFSVKDGSNTMIMADRKTTDGKTVIWKGTYTPKKAGTFEVVTYAKLGNAWETCSDGKCDVYISDKSSHSETGLTRLRASDQMIRFVGDKEGFVSNITYDTLAGNLPTLGHGYVVWEGQSFYDHLTRNEGYALLVKAVNQDNYTRDVNNMLINNKIRFNQQQFDALVSFSYNLGTGWTYGSDLKNILLNAYGPTVTTSTQSNGTMSARVTASSGLNVRKEPTTSAGIITVLNYNETVTLVSTTKYNSVWYKVKTSSGVVGYCSSTYLNVSSGSGSVSSNRDLNYVNRNALIKEMLAYHHAGGVCYYGLLYRRADELEMFLYNDYEPDGRYNRHGFPNPHCISF